MALIDSPLTPAQAVAEQIRDETRRLHNLIVSGHGAIFTLLWKTPDVDPQDVLDEFGTEATSLFQGGSDIVDLALSQDPDSIAPVDYTPPRTPTFNPDGTVTLAL